VSERTAQRPRCIIIAGPNGAGKTTFAKEFLLREVSIVRFVNADLIAGGLSPLKPELAARQAGRLVLKELSRLTNSRQNFAFESTLSGRTYLRLIAQWRKAGYRIEIVFLSLPSVQLALQRIAARVQQGGHHVPRADVLRRFKRSWNNFLESYKPLAHTWSVYDNSGKTPLLLERYP
jgi:predicted ABC-type ATPase